MICCSMASHGPPEKNGLALLRMLGSSSLLLANHSQEPEPLLNRNMLAETWLQGPSPSYTSLDLYI